jgi:purine-cytosine permease-like protein
MCAVMGLKTGLRSCSMMRYSMGWYGSKLIALFNIIEQCGWTAVGSITGGLALSAVTDRAIGSALGVIILCIISLVLSLIGVKGVMTYEQYSGIVYFTIFLIIYCQAGQYADFSKGYDFEGSNLTAGFLSVFSIMYASSASWGSIIADFYVDFPVKTPWYKTAGLTMFGIWLPTCFTMGIGAITASAMHNNPAWKATYEDKDKGIGFLIEMMLHPRPFAKVLLTILALSSLGMMSVSLYSIGLAIQQLGRPVGRVPRFIYTILAFLVVAGLGVIGSEKLIPYLVNFLSLLGYWATAYIVIVGIEHFVFRKGLRGFQMYNLEAWNDPSALPVGYAGCAAFVLGLVGAVMGMSEAWHQGPLAKLIGSSDVINGKQAHYADLGNEACFIITVLFFFPARWLEYKVMKR